MKRKQAALHIIVIHNLCYLIHMEAPVGFKLQPKLLQPQFRLHSFFFTEFCEKINLIKMYPIYGNIIVINRARICIIQVYSGK